MTSAGKTISILLAITAVIFIAFGIASITNVGEAKRASGQIVKVESASVTTISSLTLEDESGKQWTFRGSGIFAGFTPSHLEEHRVLQEPVTVEYDELESGEFVIVRLFD
ncbi:MAG: hypothetical protein HQ477_02635 [Chloroflexi bacterium]|nr:hypothetical protein [Chloroflexota bacterium]